jgi:hypothetical protein
MPAEYLSRDGQTWCRCFLCRSEFRFSEHIYGGEFVPGWDVMICQTCLDGNHDGVRLVLYHGLVRTLS